MAKLFSSFRRLLSSATSPTRYGRSINTNFSVFQEGDRVIIEGKNPLLTKPLRKNDHTNVRRGTLQHKDIIGSSARGLVQARKGPAYRITHPTLEEYVTLTPRLVTPIYSADANLIVSLLDLHVFPPSTEEAIDNDPLEILEAGTGHGSLTLHLARAIHAANSSPPAMPPTSQVQILTEGSKKTASKDNNKPENKSDSDDSQQRDWDQWRSERGAVVHTVDVSAKYSAHAETIVRGFRRGIYAGNVDFYVSTAEDWIKDQIKRRSKALFSGSVKPFLSCAILDMPSAHLRIPHVAPVMKEDGILAVFMPNVTQIGECMDIIRKQRLPFVADRVVELGSGISSGRLWDVKMVVPKRPGLKIADEEKESIMNEEAKDEIQEDTTDTSSREDVSLAYEEPSDQTVMVCRPKVGPRIVGGGFVGIWRKAKE